MAKPVTTPTSVGDVKSEPVEGSPLLDELTRSLEALIVYAQKRGASTAPEIVAAQTALEHARAVKE